MKRPLVKAWLPETLYGRAALILLAPVIAIQLIVSVVFIQRHYEGVTRQMTRNLVPEIAQVLVILDSAGDLDSGIAEASPWLVAAGLVLEPGAEVAGTDSSALFDLAGREMTETLREGLRERVLSVDLTRDPRVVHLAMATRQGTPLDLSFARRLVTATNPHQLLVIMGFASLLMTLIAFIFLRNQLRPIRLLARAAEAFGKGQSLSYHPSGAAEVRAAGTAFLDMRSRIERQIEQRTMMLSGVSHDLRTPLTRLKLGLSLLDDSEARAMSRDVSDMERLIDEFLAFARGDALDEPEECDPADLLRDLVARCTNLAVQITGIEGAGRVLLRPLAVERALDNLIVNALRYAGRADLSLSISESAVVFTVEDDGPGIPEDRREDAMKPFQRLDAARNQDKGLGAGLGLSIAYDIARRHGGVLRLGRSERLGGLKADLVLAR